jgi:hypothetical protein
MQSPWNKSINILKLWKHCLYLIVSLKLKLSISNSCDIKDLLVLHLCTKLKHVYVIKPSVWHFHGQLYINKLDFEENTRSDDFIIRSENIEVQIGCQLSPYVNSARILYISIWLLCHTIAYTIYLNLGQLWRITIRVIMLIFCLISFW